MEVCLDPDAVLAALANEKSHVQSASERRATGSAVRRKSPRALGRVRLAKDSRQGSALFAAGNPSVEVGTFEMPSARFHDWDLAAMDDVSETRVADLRRPIFAPS